MNHNTYNNPDSDIVNRTSWDDLADYTSELGASQTSTREKFYLVHEELNDRTKHAIDSTVEFNKTPEVRENIRDYYEDHEKAYIAVSSVLGGEAIEDELLDGHNGIKAAGLRNAVRQLRNSVDEGDPLLTYQLLRDLVDGAWTECCVGVLSADEGEADKMVSLSKLAEQWRLDNYGDLPQGQRSMELTHDMAKSRLLKVKELFWKDARMAGQLLYHNTPNYRDISMGGMKLGTRSYQQGEYGEYRAATMDSAGHSQSIHWTEEFDTDAYKSSMGSGRRGEAVELGATVAVPIAEIINETPYARGGTYGVVEVSAIDTASKVTINRGIRAATSESYWHNAGEDDSNPSEGGLDRTFYTDSSDIVKGVNYAYDIGRGMASDSGNVSHVVFLQRDIDRVDRQGILSKENAGKFVGSEIVNNLGEGYGIPNVHILSYDYGAGGAMGVGERDMLEGKAFVDQSGMDALRSYYGGSAELRMSDSRFLREANEEYSYQGLSKDEQHHYLEDAVAELQNSSINSPQYEGKLVVRLRGASMAYRPRG